MLYKNNSRGVLTAMDEEELSEYDIPEFVCCGLCGGEIYEFERLYEVASEYVCRECIRERLFDIYAEDYLIRRGDDDDDDELE